MTFKQEFDWYKEIDFINFLGTIFMGISENNRGILNTFLRICSHYKKVTPTQISKEFGLRSGIAERLLDILVEDFMVLKKNFSEGEFWYEIIDLSPKKLAGFNKEILKLPILTKFSLSQNPFLFNDKYVFSENLEDCIGQLDLIELIKKTNEYMSDVESKKLFNIPSKYLGIDLQQGIKVIGNSKGLISQNGKWFKIHLNNREICKINEKHPDFHSLLVDLEKIKSDGGQIKLNIEEEIKTKIPGIMFSLQINIETRELGILIDEKSIDNLGLIYYFYQEYEERINSFCAGKNWYVNLITKLIFSEPIIEFCIKFLEEMETNINIDYPNIFSKNQTAFFSKMESIKRNIPGNRVFTFTIDSFKEIIRTICEKRSNDWFQLINAKLLEDEVFE